MTENIGGEQDTNEKITRRVLLLLEGQWLLNKQVFDACREQIISRYIKDGITDHQLCRFFLNDLIRYYRTVCVDFEHKTAEKGKAWGTRNIKRVFSRKLLYFSGILIAAETWQHTNVYKVQRVKDLIAMTPIRRIEQVCGNKAERALAAYAEFLQKLSDPAIRKMTEEVSDVRQDQPEAFRLFKNQGHHFSWMLIKLLKDTYDESHAIHNAIVV